MNVHTHPLIDTKWALDEAISVLTFMSEAEAALRDDPLSKNAEYGRALLLIGVQNTLEELRGAMNPVQEFEFRGQRVRVAMWDESPWFDLEDVCEVLDITKKTILRDIAEDEGMLPDWCKVRMIDFGHQRMEALSVSGIKVLISNYPERKRSNQFRHWIRETDFNNYGRAGR